MSAAQRLALVAFLSRYDARAVAMTDAELFALLATVKAGGK